MSAAAPLSDGATLREGRDAYIERNHLPPGGDYDERWVKLKVGPFPVVFPNSASRKEAVPFHDLHHVVTGYGTDLRGEAEIGAWEVASGCWGAALRLNLLVMGFVAWWSPRSVYRAFMRGRHTENLYGRSYDELLAETIGDVRTELALATPVPAARPADGFAFARWLLAAWALNLSTLLPLVPLWLWLA